MYATCQILRGDHFTIPNDRWDRPCPSLCAKMRHEHLQLHMVAVSFAVCRCLQFCLQRLGKLFKHGVGVLQLHAVEEGIHLHRYLSCGAVELWQSGGNSKVSATQVNASLGSQMAPSLAEVMLRFRTVGTVSSL